MDSIDDSYSDDNSDDEYISMDGIKGIWYGNYAHPNINARYSRLKICDRIRQVKSEWKGAELSQKRMRKYLHKVFKVIVK